MLLADRVLFIDAEAMVLDKPAGLPVDRPRDGSLSLENHLDALRFGFERLPQAVHRLDRDTSGCLLLARNPRIHKKFQMAFERGEVTKGSIEFDGQRTDKLTTNDLVRMGVCQVMEGRHCFAHLTVEENLLTGAYTRKLSRSEIKDELERVYHYFPRLKTRRTSQSGYTSGGEQQMTAVGRALMAKPSMILLDEPSMGLAPQIVAEIFEIVKDLNTKEGVSFLLAEQNTNVALKYADYGYILESGRVVMNGDAKELASNEDVKEFYLGVSSGERTSFRDVKSYRRRKRWLA